MRKKLKLLLSVYGVVCSTFNSEAMEISEVTSPTTFFKVTQKKRQSDPDQNLKLDMGYIQIKSSSKHKFREDDPDNSYDLVQLSAEFHIKPSWKEADNGQCYYNIDLYPTNKLVSLVNYFPGNSGTFNSFSNKNFGKVDYLPGFTITEDNNSGVRRSACQPTQILMEKKGDGLRWIFRIWDAEEANYLFKANIEALWKVDSSAREINEYSRSLPFKIEIEHGFFALNLPNHMLIETFLNTPLAKILPFSFPDIIATDLSSLNNTLSFSTTNPYQFSFDNKPTDLLVATLLPLRSHRWFLSNDLLFTDYKLAEISSKDIVSTPSFAVRNNLAYGMFLDKSEKLTTIYSNDGIHWCLSKAQLEEDLTGSCGSYHPALIQHQDNLIMAGLFGDKSTKKLKLYRLMEGEENWSNIDIPTTVATSVDVALAIFKEKLHVFYVDSKSNPNVMVNTSGETYKSFPINKLDDYLIAGNIAVVSTNERIFMAYPHKNNKILFGWSTNAIGRWNFSELDMETSYPVNLLVIKDTLSLFYLQGKDSKVLCMSQYFIKENKWQKSIAYKAEFLPKLSTSGYAHSPFSVNVFDSMLIDDSKIYLSYMDATTKNLSFNYFEPETEVKKYEGSTGEFSIDYGKSL